jgi:1,4-alpha-glucan branching enzyme
MAQAGAVMYGSSLITDFDVHLFREGNNIRIFDKFGSHRMRVGELDGIYFAVWAPNAKSVSVIGDFNGWNTSAHPLGVRWDSSGIWEGFIPGVETGARYKYHIVSHNNNYTVDKGDPYAFCWETSPRTASRVWDLSYRWDDAGWMKTRGGRNTLRSPTSVYEVHLGSWRRVPEENNRYLTYREMAPQLAAYVKHMGFTHVEFMPVMEHPFYGSWGYQIIGFFAPTSRYGTPQDFMYLVDYLHQNGIGVILDWVPSHFPSDEHGLIYFDGTHLYEHADPKKGFQPEWKSFIFNYGRNEIRNFLISNAVFWLEKYHIDGLRIDAVASMLYLDYSRKPGEWTPNQYGGNENIEAISFLKQLNHAIYGNFPDTQTIAEESTAWPMVSRPTHLGGLGFGMKWNMGWMHDTLEYFSRDPIFRKYHHNQLTFSIWYAFFENFVLPLSHDEVVYGKGSLLNKMPGSEWDKFANLRLLLGYMYMHPGKKLLFMGGEFGQWNEWDHEKSLDWHLTHNHLNNCMQRWVHDVNAVYKDSPALFERDFESGGFRWIDCNNWEESITSFIRNSASGETVLVVCNFTPVPRYQYVVGVPEGGYWKEALNSDALDYGGSGHGNFGGVESAPVSSYGMAHSLSITVPPLGMVVFKK